MTTTVAYLTSIVSTLSVSGVAREFTAPPQSLNTADLPASFPRGFRRRQRPMTFGTHGGWPEMGLDFFIAGEPVAQNNPAPNYALIQTMADALDVALAAAAPLAIGKGILTWEIRGGDVIIDVAGIAYWAIMATITGHG